MKKVVDMGEHYFSKDGVHVKTVCKAQHVATKVEIIVYTEVLGGGSIEGLLWTNEEDFISRFLAD